MATIKLFCGPERSERSAQMDALLAAHWNRFLLLTPTRAHARRRAAKLLLHAPSRGLWGACVQQFTDFTESLLRQEGVDGRIASPLEQRMVLDACLQALADDHRLEKIVSPKTRAGLARHLLRVITQLKQGAIEPEEFRAKTGTGGSGDQMLLHELVHDAPEVLDLLVARVYEGYQKHLRERALFDVPGLYWAADIICKHRIPAILNGVDVLALDGFDDFTPSEFRLLRSLGKHAKTLVVGLNHDSSPDRVDLYGRSAEVLAGLQRTFAAETVSFVQPRPARLSEYVADTIFWRNVPAPPSELTVDLEIRSCITLRHEVETIGRLVKQLIVERQVSPERIAVVFREITSVAHTLESVFREFGIPLRVISPCCLAESAVGAFLQRLFEAASDWRRETVLDVLLSPWYGPGKAQQHRALFPVLARRAQIIEGYDTWVERLIGLRDSLAPDDLDPPDFQRHRSQEERTAVDALLECVQVLHQLMEALPQRASVTAHAIALDRLLDRLNLEKAIDHCDDACGGSAQKLALDAIRAAVATIAATSDFGLSTNSSSAATTGDLSRDEFALFFRQVLEESSCSRPGNGSGVFCADPGSVRNLEFDYVFVAGVNEGQFPQRPPQNAIYGPNELTRLRRKGIPLEGSTEFAARERLQFHHAIVAAGKGAILTWRQLDAEGRESLPSPFLAEINELVAPVMPHALEIRNNDLFLPDPRLAASTRDVGNIVFRSGERVWSTWSDQFPQAVRGARSESLRQRPVPFDEHDGVFTSLELRTQLAQCYDEEHLFSVQQLETYRSCPFRFFVERVLEIDDLPAPEAEFDPRVRGQILHDALQSFYNNYRGRPIAEIPADAGAATLAQCLDESFQKYARAIAVAPQGVQEAERLRLRTTLLRQFQIEQARQEPWMPMHFELAFGDARPSRKDAASTEAPFTLETEAGPVRFSGRMDRVDVYQANARIVDYKTGSTPAKQDILAGRSLQLSIYAWALERLLRPDLQCAEAVYATVGKKKHQDALLKKKPEDSAERCANALAAVAAAVEGARSGHFPPDPQKKDSCNGCGHARVCRYNFNRIERKRTART